MKNKAKLLTYILTMSLSAATLGGCGSSSDSSRFNYSTNENGETVVEGTISYNSLKDYKVVELRFLDSPSQLIIAKLIEVPEVSRNTRYKDIITGKSVYYVFDESITIINEINLEGFLSAYDEVKERYTIEDVEKIYNKIVENYEFATDKVLKK